ncbi:39659_t:CDS:2, partial [Gigaspora margarita]
RETQNHLAECSLLDLVWSVIEKEYTELVIKKGANGKKYDKKVQESIFKSAKSHGPNCKRKGAITITQDLVNLVQSRFIEHIWKFRCELMAEWEVKEGIAKDNKQKPQSAEEISDSKLFKKQKVKKRVNKENQDPLRE